MFSAFHLPALPNAPSTTWSYGQGERAVEVRIPQLTPALLKEQIQGLLTARDEHLVQRPVAEIVAAIDGVANRFLDPTDPLRQAAEEALPAVTGSSVQMARRVLDGMAVDWRAPRLWDLLRSEFGDPGVLDGYRPRPGATGQTRVFGPRLTLHVFSGNVPGVAVTSLVRALLVKSASLGKTAVGEPLLTALFARGIAEADPGLGSCLAVTYWPGGEGNLERAALEASDAVIVYGGQEAVNGLRARTPATARFLGYGHKLSFGVIAREALGGGRGAEELARRAARDVALFDQHGCVSPHLFYVEEGGEVGAERWAELLARQLESVEAELPRGKLAPGEAAAIRQLRGEMEFAQLAGQGVVLHASEGTAWTVIYDPAARFSASCLNRVVRVKPVAELDEVLEQVRPIASVLQTVGLSGPSERVAPLAEQLGRFGASRVAPVGDMAWPPPYWHHDGRPPLLDLVRWCDWEPSD